MLDTDIHCRQVFGWENVSVVQSEIWRPLFTVAVCLIFILLIPCTFSVVSTTLSSKHYGTTDSERSAIDPDLLIYIGDHHTSEEKGHENTIEIYSVRLTPTSTQKPTRLPFQFEVGSLWVSLLK